MTTGAGTIKARTRGKYALKSRASGQPSSCCVRVPSWRQFPAASQVETQDIYKI
jgi:hypothetical protein